MNLTSFIPDKDLANKLWRSSRGRKARKKALQRDKCICQICGVTRKLEVHHKNDKSHFIDLMFELDNLVVVCKKCHSQFHNNFKRNYRESCTTYDWANFLALVKYIKTLKE